MKKIILKRLGQKRTSEYIPKDPTILIRIVNPFGKQSVYTSMDESLYVDVLHLKFSDVDLYRYPIKTKEYYMTNIRKRNHENIVFFDEKMAKQILTFVKKNINKCDMILCHCLGGFSRSPGVLMGLKKSFEECNYEKFNPSYYNKFVSETIIKTSENTGY
jgi:predicted protein tyrosine phosphatase